MEKHFYTYRINDILTGEFYIGSRICYCLPENDPYMGSMETWKRQSDFDSSRHIKTVLNVFFDSESMRKDEFTLIEKHKYDPLNRNYHNTEKWHTIGLAKTDSWKEKISSSMKGRKLTDEHKKRISESRKGKSTGTRSKETCQKISEALKGKPAHNKGKKISEAEKDKRRKPHPKGVCPICGNSYSVRILKRYHFNKCKLLKTTMCQD
jgi:hypothetical protein